MRGAFRMSEDQSNKIAAANTNLKSIQYGLNLVSGRILDFFS